MIWRWHFYAGIFCIPFVIWLAVTGSIYLFRPDIEALLDRPYVNLPMAGPAALPSARVAVALSAVPGSNLHAYQMPEHDNDATQILVGRGGDEYRVYVHPQSLRILKVMREDDRPMRVLFHLHGELLMGDRGSMIVELAASWAIVLLLTGLYLWWPSNRHGFGGVVYPRVRAGSRVLWRDLHAVTAVWVSLFALFLLVSGLPWAKSWGSLLREARQWGSHSTVVARQDWTTGSSDEAAARKALDAPPVGDNAEHAAHVSQNADSGDREYRAIDAVARAAQDFGLAAPVLIAPPSSRNAHWTARSDAANRPLRAEVALDTKGHALRRTEFAQRPLIDRLVGYGVAAHEGQLFGRLNQALGVFTAIGLILVAVSAVKLWSNRRPEGTLGAMVRTADAKLSLPLAGVIIVLAVVLPLLGISLIAVLLAERLFFRRIPTAAQFLGLDPAMR
jgi:uncharacterized iron-regulated membrane protein